MIKNWIKKKYFTYIFIPIGRRNQYHDQIFTIRFNGNRHSWICLSFNSLQLRSRAQASHCGIMLIEQTSLKNFLQSNNVPNKLLVRFWRQKTQCIKGIKVLLIFFREKEWFSLELMPTLFPIWEFLYEIL